MEKIKCIYAIKDKRSDKVLYIGQTKDFKRRKNEHFKDIEQPIDNFMLQNGRDNFEMYVLEEINEDISLNEIKNKENFYINKFDTYNNGFNMYHSGNCTDEKSYQLEYSRTEKRMKQISNYKKNNREKINEQNRKWRINNLEQSREYNRNYAKQWREVHKEEYKQYRKERYLKKKLESQDK